MAKLGIYELQRGHQIIRLKLNEHDATRLGARPVTPEAAAGSEPEVKKSAAAGNKARPGPGNKTASPAPADIADTTSSDGSAVESGRRPGGGRGPR